MAKLTPVVLNEPDYLGNWIVKIRIGHKSKSAFIETDFEVGKKSVDKQLNVKPDFVIENLMDLLKKYKSYISQMNIEEMSAAEIKAKIQQLESQKDEGDVIDFLAFSRSYMKTLKKSTADTFRAVVNSLEDFMDGKVLSVNDITSKFLKQYEAYLRSPRVLNRMNRGKLVEYHKEAAKDRGVHNKMRDLRILFNQAKERYNDEEIGLIRIPNNPFKKYKVVDAPETEDRDLSIEELLIVRDVRVITRQEDLSIRNAAMKVPKDKREFSPDYIVSGSMGELARDLGMLSFYLCGMNAADMFELLESKSARINYKRKKTRDRRKDEAYISIKIPEVARQLYDKYAGGLQKKYVDLASLNGVIKKGMDRLALATGIEEMQLIRFRHSFASLARNKARFSRDDVALAMNHKDSTHKVTDIYLSKDWSIVDEVQEKTIALLV